MRLKLGLRYTIPVIIVLILILFAVYNTYFSTPKILDIDPMRETRFLMDTIVTVQIYAENAEEYLQAAFERMNEIIWQADRFNPEGDVGRINDNAGQGPVEVSAEIYMLIEKALEISRDSQELFTIAIAPLMDLWGFANNDFRVPEQAEIAEILPYLDSEGIILHPETTSVELKAGYQLDLGGVAKGYIVDQGVAIMEEMGAIAAFINAGGDIRVIGPKPDQTPWRIGIRDPRDQKTSDHLADYVLHITTASVVTSGDYERGFFDDSGERYHHILDPRTGYPARSIKSSTIVGPSGLAGDIYSTLLFMLGVEEGINYIEGLADYEALIIDNQGVIYTTSGLQQFIK